LIHLFRPHHDLAVKLKVHWNHKMVLEP
jgi:hypothetical protein